LKIDTNVTFLVKPSNAIVRSILGVSSIYIFPSEWEAFGISTLEAMAKKNAVITTKTEGGKFLIEDGVNGILVDYGHSDQIAKAIETLHNDKDLLTKMQANNFKKSQEFSMEKIILDYQHLLYE
jgi:glycosyltransferase involved in cell wall biosynthesis